MNEGTVLSYLLSKVESIVRPNKSLPFASCESFHTRSTLPKVKLKIAAEMSFESPSVTKMHSGPAVSSLLKVRWQLLLLDCRATTNNVGLFCFVAFFHLKYSSVSGSQSLIISINNKTTFGFKYYI